MYLIDGTTYNTDGVSKEFLWVNNCGFQGGNGDSLAIRRPEGRTIKLSICPKAADFITWAAVSGR